MGTGRSRAPAGAQRPIDTRRRPTGRGAEDYTAGVWRTTYAEARPPKPPAADPGVRGGHYSPSELVARPCVPERSRQIVGAGVVAVQRAREADRRTGAEDVVHTGLDLKSSEPERIRPRQLHVVIEDRAHVVDVFAGLTARYADLRRVAAGLGHRRQEAQVPVDAKASSSPAKLRVDAPARDRAVADFDADLALIHDAERVFRLVVVDARRLQPRRQVAEAQGLGQPVALHVDAARCDIGQILQEVLWWPQLAARYAGERLAQRRIDAAGVQARGQQRLNVLRLDSALDLVVVVRGLEVQALSRTMAFRPTGAVHDPGRVAVGLFRVEFLVTARERRDLRVGLLEIVRHALRPASLGQR